MPNANKLLSLTRDADLLKGSVRTLPVTTGALHHDIGRINGCTPFRQGPAVTLEGTKLTVFLSKTTALIFNQSTRRNLGLMNIKANHPAVDRFNFHIHSI